MNRTLGIVFGAIALLAVVVVLLGYFGGDSSQVDLILLEVNGDITVTGVERSTRPARLGETLASQDTLQTGVGGRVVVGIGGDGRLDIGPQTEVQITSVDGDDVEVELFGGRMSARVMPDSRAVRIARDARAIIVTDAELDVAVDADGDLFVQVERGAASVEGILGAFEVSAGQRLATRDGRVAEIGPVPTSLLLEVQWPAGTRVRRAAFRVQGTTRSAIPIDLSGGATSMTVEADQDGNFSAELELVEGENTLIITAQDPLGETTTSERIIRLDSTGPAFSGDVEYHR